MAIIEIIRFRPRPNRQDELLRGRADAVSALTSAFRMEHSTLCAGSDGVWTDIMRFPSAEDADEALAHEMELPDFANWVANVEAVVSRERLELVAP